MLLLPTGSQTLPLSSSPAAGATTSSSTSGPLSQSPSALPPSTTVQASAPPPRLTLRASLSLAMDLNTALATAPDAAAAVQAGLACGLALAQVPSADVAVTRLLADGRPAASVQRLPTRASSTFCSAVQPTAAAAGSSVALVSPCATGSVVVEVLVTLDSDAAAATRAVRLLLALFQATVGSEGASSGAATAASGAVSSALSNTQLAEAMTAPVRRYVSAAYATTGTSATSCGPAASSALTLSLGNEPLVLAPDATPGGVASPSAGTPLSRPSGTAPPPAGALVLMPALLVGGGSGLSLDAQLAPLLARPGLPSPSPSRSAVIGAVVVTAGPASESSGGVGATVGAVLGGLAGVATAATLGLLVLLRRRRERRRALATPTVTGAAPLRQRLRVLPALASKGKAAASSSSPSAAGSASRGAEHKGAAALSGDGDVAIDTAAVVPMTLAGGSGEGTSFSNPSLAARSRRVGAAGATGSAVRSSTAPTPVGSLGALGHASFGYNGTAQPMDNDPARRGLVSAAGTLSGAAGTDGAQRGGRPTDNDDWGSPLQRNRTRTEPGAMRPRVGGGAGLRGQQLQAAGAAASSAAAPGTDASLRSRHRTEFAPALPARGALGGLKVGRAATAAAAPSAAFPASAGATSAAGGLTKGAARSAGAATNRTEFTPALPGWLKPSSSQAPATKGFEGAEDEEPEDGEGDGSAPTATERLARLARHRTEFTPALPAAGRGGAAAADTSPRSRTVVAFPSAALGGPAGAAAAPAAAASASAAVQPLHQRVMPRGLDEGSGTAPSPRSTLLPFSSLASTANPLRPAPCAGDVY